MKKIIWLILSCLMIISLVLASCAPKVTEEEEVVTPPTEKEKEVVVTPPTEKEKEVVPAGPEMVKLSLKKVDGTVVEKMVEKPRYGGTLNLGYTANPGSFDPADSNPQTADTVVYFLYETLLIGDYYRSPNGTNEYDFTHYRYMPTPMITGNVAESWEQPEPLTYIWHIRKGVYWQNIPPVNGREMTAEDVAYSVLRQKASPRMSPTVFGIVESVKATDKYTVVFKLKQPDFTLPVELGTTYNLVVYAREMVEKYGNLASPDAACGTGAWMLEDYLRGSVITYKRNPNYWKKDPFFPENTLPYADNVKVLIVPDTSTRITAMRTGKIDILVRHLSGMSIGVCWQDAVSLKKTAPHIRQLPYVDAAGLISLQFRVDKPPFNDIRVRQALTLAVNQDEVLQSYLQGNGQMNNYPTMQVWGEDVWTPLEKMPTEPTLPGSKCSVRELFTYNPEKAKQLLAEAGYPNGFNTDVVCVDTEADVTSMIAAYWKKVGVNLEIHVKDLAVKSAMVGAKPRTYPEGMMIQAVNAGSPTGVWQGEFFSLGSYNVGNISDPRIDQTYLDILAEPDQAKRNKMSKDLCLYVLEQAYKLVGPHPYVFNFWQPWVKNCEGATYLGIRGFGNSFAYYWVDQDLKKQMTGR